MKTVIQQIDDLIRRRQLGEGEKLCHHLLEQQPENADGWFRLGQIRQMKCDFDAMLDCARRVIAINPDAPLGYLQEIDALIHGGRIDEAVGRIEAREKNAGNDVQMLSHLAEFYTHAGQFPAAERCYHKARAVCPDDPKILYNCATTAIATGKLAAAEQLFDRVIKIDPHDYDACYNRATLRQQTDDNNHIDELLKRVNGGIRHPAGEVQIYYALAKEYEDLGQYKKSFACLTKGAERRNSMLQYEVAEDEEAIKAIISAMSTDFFKRAIPVEESPAPVFIVGLPRSGTTLVDRILSSHSEVDSLGEINDFALSLMSMIGQTSGKLDMIAKSAHMDFHQLGRKYLSSIRSRNSAMPYLIDKTPANYLYIGLIARALPDARIIHLRRNPMDSCYAMYKTLFRMGYPFSYSLENLARYYIAWHDLMTHWNDMLPGRILDVDYETLVQDQENISRRIVAHCGLDWQPECLDFHLNKSPTATASAAQVRRPIYRASMGKWQAYKQELQPLRDSLEMAAIPVEPENMEQRA